MSETPTIKSLLEMASLPPEWAETVSFTNENVPTYDTCWKLGQGAATSLGAQAAAINLLWDMKTGTKQTAVIDVPAAALSLNGFEYELYRGHTMAYPEPSYPTTGFFKCIDGRWIFTHGGYPRLRNGILDLLGCANNVEAIANKIITWHSEELQEAIAERGLCGAVLLSREEWLNSEQGRAMADQPVVKITKIADSDPKELPKGDRPLSGVRVFDLTHVIAGPVASRTLGEQGADILKVTTPTQPFIGSFVIDTGWGKRASQLDFNDIRDLEIAHDLLATGDILVQSYRPNSINKYGMSPEKLAQHNPHIIHVDVCCYGWEGPWQLRPGWEQLGQTVTGLAAENSSMDAPELAPCCPCDYNTGYLAAFGALAALYLRATEGGAYHVEVSLARSAMYAMEFGKWAPGTKLPLTPPQSLVDRERVTSESPYGPISHLKPISQFSETKASWAHQPTVPLSYNPPEWLEL